VKISSSNLALRFYKKDGWTQEFLDSLTTKGSILPHTHFDKDEASGWGGYYIPKPGTQMNIPELMKHVTEVYRAFDDYPHMTDEQFIEHMLW
jgi:hypothetical protein